MLEVAEECVSELGLLGATSNEIARRAGVSWGVIQYHFGSREGLLLAIVEDGFATLLDELDASVAPNAATATRVRRVVNAVWEYCSRPDYMLYTDIIRVLRRDAESTRGLEEMLQRADEELADHVANVLRPAVPPKGKTIRTIVRLVFATMRGLAMRRSFGATDDDFEAERELLVRSLVLTLEDDRARRTAGKARRR